VSSSLLTIDFSAEASTLSFEGWTSGHHFACLFAYHQNRKRTQVQGPNHGAFLRVDYRDEWSLMAQHPNTSIERIKQDPRREDESKNCWEMERVTGIEPATFSLGK
jgi:hypothetical protein